MEVEHYIRAGAYKEAVRILLEIDPYLLLWCAYKDVVQWHERLQDKISDLQLKAGSLANLGTAYLNMGQYQKALSCYEHSLTIAISPEVENWEMEALSLGNLGACYLELEQPDRATQYFRRALARARRIRRRATDKVTLLAVEGRWISNLGVCSEHLGEIKQAIKYYQRALVIADKIKDLETMGACLGNLGNCYASLGQSKHAVDYYNQALAFQKNIGDWSAQGTVLHSLAETSIDKEHFTEAIDYAHRGLEIGHKFNNPKLRNENNGVLASAYLYLGRLTNALEAAIAAQQDDVPENNHYILALLGLIALRQGDQLSALKAFEKALGCASALLAQNARNFKALNTKGLALCGLVLCKNRACTTAAIAAYRAARAINSAVGVARRALRLFDALALADTEGVLAAVRTAIEILDNR